MNGASSMVIYGYINGFSVCSLVFEDEPGSQTIDDLSRYLEGS